MSTENPSQINLNSGQLQKLMSILNGWHLNQEQQISLLGLPQNARKRMLRSLSAGNPLLSQPHTLQRMLCIVQIHNTLQLIHPQNRAMADYWITTPHNFFADQTPLQVMLERGLDGMHALLDHLNGTGDW